MGRAIAVLVLTLLAYAPASAGPIPSQPVPPNDAACCVAFLPKTRSFVYATVVGQVCISGPGSHVLFESENPVVALAVSPDGKMLVCSFQDSRSLVWDIEKSREVVRILHPANSVAFSPDGKHLATAGKSGLFLRNAVTGKEVWKADEPTDCVAFAPDGSKLAAAVQQGLRLHEPVAGKVLREMNWSYRQAIELNVMDFTSFTRGLTFSPSGRRIAITESGATRKSGRKEFTQFLDSLRSFSDQKAEARVWEVATGREVLEFAGKTDEACGPVFAPSGRLVAFADRANIIVWDIARNECADTFASREPWISGLAISHDGKLLASAGYEGVKLWDMPPAKPMEQEPADAHALLDSRDAEAATQAVFALAANPRQSLPLLREGLRPAHAVSDQVVAKLLDDLDSDHLPVRQKATAQLERLERMAAPALKNLLASRPSLEVRRRAEHLLAQLDEPNLSPEILRSLRAVEVLERIGSPEATKLLGELAEGEGAARLTQEAKAALARMKR